MFTLYEVRNGYVGVSYVRSYVWTDRGEEHALELAKERFQTDGTFGQAQPGRPWMDLTARALFNVQDAAFATETDDEGWIMALPLCLSGQ